MITEVFKQYQVELICRTVLVEKWYFEIPDFSCDSVDKSQTAFVKLIVK